MWAPSQNDAPQRFVVSYTYTLPIYQLTHRRRRLTDDWNLVGIYTLQHGTPIPVFDFAESSLTCDLGAAFYACPDRADRTGAALVKGDPRAILQQGLANAGAGGDGSYWFTNGTSAFVVPAPGTGIGNASRNPIYGPGIN